MVELACWFEIGSEREDDSTPKPIGIEYLLESVFPREIGVI